MPTPNPTLRREYKGAAAATTLQNPMTNTDLSFVLVAANNWPTGAVGKFIVTINRGLADEEKILCDSQTTRTVACLLANRGFDGTTAQAHAAGATVECTISAFDADEWNQHTNATTGVHGVAGAVVGTTDTQTLTNKTLNSPTVNNPTVAGATLDAASTIGGVSGTALAAARAAWTAYTPGLFNITLGNGTLIGRYLQIGKTVFFKAQLIFGTTTAITGVQAIIGLPVTVLAGNGDYPVAGTAFKNSSSSYWQVGGVASSGGTNCSLTTSTGPLSSTVPFTFAVGDAIDVAGSYEAA